jgi:hypothetical protein
MRCAIKSWMHWRRNSEMPEKKQTRYAEGTTVSVPRTREEIEKTLMRYGATGFMYGESGDTAAVAFEMQGRHIRLELRYPPLSQFARSKTVIRTQAQQEAARAQEIRRLWRGLAMIVKAKLEAMKSGVITFEDAFGMSEVMPNGQRFETWAEPQLEQMRNTRQMPPLLPWVKPKRQALTAAADYIEGEVRTDEE